MWPFSGNLLGPQPALLSTMSVVSRGVPQSIDSRAMDEDACEAHAHTLEVLHQWQELQGAVREIAAPKHADEG